MGGFKKIGKALFDPLNISGLFDDKKDAPAAAAAATVVSPGPVPGERLAGEAVAERRKRSLANAATKKASLLNSPSEPLGS